MRVYTDYYNIPLLIKAHNFINQARENCYTQHLTATGNPLAEYKENYLKFSETQHVNLYFIVINIEYEHMLKAKSNYIPLLTLRTHTFRLTEFISSHFW